VRFDGGPFIVTANHVLTKYEERRRNEALNWQFGHLPPFDSVPRIAWRDPGRDVVLLAISEEEVVGACNASEFAIDSLSYATNSISGIGSR
jgi:hypothetical protein